MNYSTGAFTAIVFLSSFCLFSYFSCPLTFGCYSWCFSRDHSSSLMSSSHCFGSGTVNLLRGMLTVEEFSETAATTPSA